MELSAFLEKEGYNLCHLKYALCVFSLALRYSGVQQVHNVFKVGFKTL